VTSIHFILY